MGIGSEALRVCVSGGAGEEREREGEERRDKGEGGRENNLMLTTFSQPPNRVMKN